MEKSSPVEEEVNVNCSGLGSDDVGGGREDTRTEGETRKEE